MKTSLQLKTSQHLALTPQLQQSIRLLQLSTQELQQEIDLVMESNPLIERDDDQLDGSVRLLADGAINPATEHESKENHLEANDHIASSEATTTETQSSSDTEIDWSQMKNDYPSRVNTTSDDDNAHQQIEAPQLSLHDHLLEQMRLNFYTQKEKALLTILIDAVNENGYLSESIDEIIQWLPDEIAITKEEVSACLSTLQSFDPPGIGARNIAECLTIQIKQLEGIPFITRRNALHIVEDHLDTFAKRDFKKLKKQLSCDDEDLREACDVIKLCHPHPGAPFSTNLADTIIPDIIIKRINNAWQPALNPHVVPRLHLNAAYANLLKGNRSNTSLSGQLQEAKWFIKNVQQRFQTILRVSDAIVERQKNFFTHGPIAMRPLVLREIADTLGLHESTISRVTNQKYMLTPHGMYELKFFFGSHVSTEAGGEASSTTIRELIKQLIGAENPQKPLSDSKIAAMLNEQGMVVARRTVAKYRESMRIQPVSLRKSL